ncbi:hypothetical protein BJ878DRAFT_507732 [Calycina marina]|uniref:mRNA 3'-end-processing protein RNA14 n=1 Tax=Calycina marina TaxID=1763456 RepID=A0A9P7Z205_9HELO|nr:hypothetical protein BJ878DRAFT_507732 [Calycina marina]
MAGEDAEIALLRQLQAEQETAGWDNTGINADGEPSNTEDMNEEDRKQTVEDTQVLRAISPSDSTTAVSDGGSYDPTSISSLAVPAVKAAIEEESRSSSRASSRRPRTVGGFLADSDDEDASTPISSGLQAAGSVPHKRSASPSPLQTSVAVESLPAQGNSNTTTPAPTASSVTVPALSVPAVTVPKARLPHDKIGILEDRIAEDPRGDLEAWRLLIDEHRGRHKLEEAREVYERFIKIFPQAAEMWVEYLEMEMGSDQFNLAEQIFGKSLMAVPNIGLWTKYLNYVRRMNDLRNDATGNNRTTVSQAYEFVLNNIGNDRDSGTIWKEYIEFLRAIPGTIGGSGWQDGQKLDIMRKAYHRAIGIPMTEVSFLWKEYDQFENGANKMTARKYTHERSGIYMTARSANAALENIHRTLDRSTIPKLPPADGFEGHQEYMQQVEQWKKWISWEQEDPLQLKKDELDVFKKRMLYVFKQAVMTLRFWPEMWVDASEWCLNNGFETEGAEFLSNGIAANPESCLLALKHADVIEKKGGAETGKGPKERGEAVRAPYDKLISSLYELHKQVKAREAKEMVKVEEEAAKDAEIDSIIAKATEGDEDNNAAEAARQAKQEQRQKDVRTKFESELMDVRRAISATWVALMRAMRRVQGKGNPKAEVGGSRAIFAESRAKGKILSDVYVASALLEHHVYKDPAGTKIFERGARLFPDDPEFILEYLKHLISIGDTTNARVVFETTVSKLTANSDKVEKAKPLYIYFHQYESNYGELVQIRKLEQRMAELFPEDPKLLRFSERFGNGGFSAVDYQPIISMSQVQPKAQVMQSIEPVSSPTNQYTNSYMQDQSPRPQYLQPPTNNSPKRPLPPAFEQLQDDLTRPRKIARGESPLKGAAGRRLEAQQRRQGGAAPFVIPRDVNFLLGIIPRADTYNATKFNSDALVRLLQNTSVPNFDEWKMKKDQGVLQHQQQQGWGGGYR